MDLNIDVEREGNATLLLLLAAFNDDDRDTIERVEAMKAQMAALQARLAHNDHRRGLVERVLQSRSVSVEPTFLSGLRQDADRAVAAASRDGDTQRPPVPPRRQEASQAPAADQHRAEVQHRDDEAADQRRETLAQDPPRVEQPRHPSAPRGDAEREGRRRPAARAHVEPDVRETHAEPEAPRSRLVLAAEQPARRIVAPEPAEARQQPAPDAYAGLARGGTAAQDTTLTLVSAHEDLSDEGGADVSFGRVPAHLMRRG